MKLRVDLLGLIETVAEALEKRRDGGTAFALREAGENLATIAREPERWPEFAELYCLKPEDLDRRGR